MSNKNSKNKITKIRGEMMKGSYLSRKHPKMKTGPKNLFKLIFANAIFSSWPKPKNNFFHPKIVNWWWLKQFFVVSKMLHIWPKMFFLPNSFGKNLSRKKFLLKKIFLSIIKIYFWVKWFFLMAKWIFFWNFKS